MPARTGLQRDILRLKRSNESFFQTGLIECPDGSIAVVDDWMSSASHDD